MACEFFTILFFLLIFIAPCDKLEDRITGNRRGVIPIAIATAKVKDNVSSCLLILIKKTIGINININLIKSFDMASTPFSNEVFGFDEVNVSAICPKYVFSPV
ncbi:hypothetical protein D3C72_1851690 [compost metagenome]